ncbi:MAG: hypothetical protein JW839_08415 [Candidatus Lokiarchaeota archaeon]|nr:hypothetical protein [Candidatus Lokiarchaeota archaeon]
MATYPAVSFVSVIPIVISMLLGVRQYKKTGQLGAVYFIATCLFFAASFIVWGISDLLDDDSIVMNVAPFLGACSAATIVLHADAISRDMIDPVKLIIVTTVSMGAVVGGGFYIRIAFIIALQMFSLVVWVYYARKIHVKAPAAIKPWSRLNLAGIVLFAIGSLWGSSGIAGSSDSIPEALDVVIDVFRWEVILGISFVLIAIAYAKEPNLANVLPFVAIRLSIIDIKAGIALYNHDWARRDDLIHEDLFSSMLSGISMILNESVRKGNIREIVLDKARLLLKRSDEYSIAFVLITSHPTKALRNALEVFASRFNARYGILLKEQNKDIEIGKYRNTTDIVHECFPFAVEYTSDEGAQRAPEPASP